MIRERIKDDLSWQEIREKIVILDMSEKRMFHEFNETASFIWKQIQKNLSETEISRELSKVYAVTEEEALIEIKSFIKELEAKELIS